MKFFAILIFFFASINVFFAQIPGFMLNNYSKENFPNLICSHQSSKITNLTQRAKTIYHRPYNVINYDLFLNWHSLLLDSLDSGPSRYFDAINKITLQIDTVQTNSISLDSYFQQIKSVLIDGNDLQFETSAGQIIIQLPRDYLKDEIITLDIHYTYQGEQVNGGFYIFNKGTATLRFPESGYQDSILHRICYTMSQPNSARIWMPCNDSPHDKASSRMSVRVPLGFTVAGNGKLADVFTDDSSHLYVWESQQQIATYLMHATASVFDVHREYFNRLTAPHDTVPLEYYVWSEDWENFEGEQFDFDADGEKNNAKLFFSNTLPMMDFFSRTFVDYPFNKYGQVVVQNFWAAGMEHQTISTMNRYLIKAKLPWTGTRNNLWGNQMVLAHELAHQWLGDLITCASWNDIWINEGGAVFSECLWNAEINQSEDAYYSLLYSKKRQYLDSTKKLPGGLHRSAIYGLPIADVFNTALTYNKASWVYNNLMNMIGKQTFWNAFQRLLDKHKFSSITTEDFKNSFKENVSNPDVDLDVFFDQWVYSAGHPVFDVTLSTFDEGNLFRTELQLVQIQKIREDIPEVFQTPLWIKFISEDGDVEEFKVLNIDKAQSFSFELPFRAKEVILDTNKVLLEVNNVISSVEDTKLNYKSDSFINIYPNPLSSEGILKINGVNSIAGETELAIIDILGNSVLTRQLGFLSSGSFDLSIKLPILSQGTYSLILRNPYNRLYSSFVVN